eukprot:c18146_g1_i1 orf=172-2544(-)
MLPISVKYIEQPVADYSTVLFNTKVQEGITGNAFVVPLEASYAAYQNVKEALVSAGMVLEEPFRTFFCPLSGRLMKDPVMTSCSTVYERDEIAQWFQQCRLIDHILEDPITKERLVDDSLVPVTSLQQTIVEWRERNSLIYITVAKEALLDGVQRLGVLKGLLSICQDMQMAKDWIKFEGLLPLIVKCLKDRSLDVRKSTFMLLKLVYTDQHFEGEAADVTKCIELASGSLLRGLPLLEAAEFLEELAKSQYGRTQIAQVPSAVVALVTCATTANDTVVKQTVESTLMLLSDTDDVVIKMAQANWCSPLLKCLNGGLQERKLAMIAFLAEGTLSKESNDYLVQNGIILVLFAMLQSQEELKSLIIRALVTLSSEQNVLYSMIEAGLVTILRESFCEKESPSLKFGAACILENLTVKCGVGYLVQTFGQTSLTHLVSNLISILGDLTLPVTAASVHIHLLKILLEIAQSPDALYLAHSIRNEQGCLEVLLTLMKPQVAQVCVLSLDLLSLLCDGKEGEAMALSLLKNARSLLDLLEDDSTSLDVHIAVAGVLARLPYVKSMPVSVKALSALVRLSKVSNSRGQVQAVGALLLFMQEAAVQHALVEEDFIFYLVQMLSYSSSLAKSRAALALKAFSLTTQLLYPSKKQTFALFNSRTNCPVHSIQCKVKKNFCIVKAGAVPKLVLMLEDSTMEVAEAALDTLFTILQTEITVVNGARLLHDLGAVDKLLHLATSKSVNCSEKSLDTLERIFTVPEIRSKYALRARRAVLSLIGCQQSPHLCQKAVRMLSTLG